MLAAVKVLFIAVGFLCKYVIGAAVIYVLYLLATGEALVVNLIALTIVLALTFTSKHKNIGVLVSVYYAFYICLELSYLGLVPGSNMLSLDDQSLWFLICMALGLLVFIASAILMFDGDNSAFMYAGWLLLVMLINGASSVLKLTDPGPVIDFVTMIVLMVYNVIQNISVLVDLFVVFIGMDHMLKRNYSGANTFINSINNYLDVRRVVVVSLCNKGPKCNKKSSTN